VEPRKEEEEEEEGIINEDSLNKKEGSPTDSERYKI
jgi:hypothetical protein